MEFWGYSLLAREPRKVLFSLGTYLKVCSTLLQQKYDMGKLRSSIYKKLSWAYSISMNKLKRNLNIYGLAYQLTTNWTILVQKILPSFAEWFCLNKLLRFRKLCNNWILTKHHRRVFPISLLSLMTFLQSLKEK